jgi:hypothetical protein
LPELKPSRQLIDSHLTIPSRDADVRHGRGRIAITNGIKELFVIRGVRPVRTTGRDLVHDFASEYVKHARAKAAFVSTSWHNHVLNVSESIVAQHAAELTVRRRQLTFASGQGLDDSRWLQEVERFITDVIDKSGGYVRNSPGRLRAVTWMIASATAQFALTAAPSSLHGENAVVRDAA